MTHFHTAFSAVLTCVGTGSTLGSIFKGKKKKPIYLRFAPQKGHQWSWAHLSLLLVLNKRSLLQEIPLFIHIYMD